ncbi:MAG TPA: hypothetical protein VGX68_20790 [Thermoanaerobaculia bacterium]|nr:hypothetical protein [Thermoanaerobaculia bacterium]
MNPLKLLLAVLKSIGREKLAAEFGKVFRKKTTPARWAEIAAGLERAAAAAKADEREAVAEEVVAILVGIKV